MKRYRIIAFSFDTKIDYLESIEDTYETNPSAGLKNQIENFKNRLKEQYGARNFENKLQNLRDIGSKKFSIISHHNLLIEEIRNSFINENYYPALTSACALGERILNHLIIDLRDYYTDTVENTKIKKYKSNSNWKQMISIINDWNFITPDVAIEFGKLSGLRNRAVHFNPEIIDDLRTNALNSILCIQKILFEQFSAFGNQPWFITEIPGEIYIKSEWELNPFIIKYYLPNSIYVGYNHKIKNLNPFEIEDINIYENTETTDEEFVKCRKN